MIIYLAYKVMKYLVKTSCLPFFVSEKHYSFSSSRKKVRILHPYVWH